MAYELRYTIAQALRDGTTLTANIYEKDFVGDVITYEAINISLESNASNDEPLAGIISSQLNISFLTTEENGEDFPSILSFDIRKYFVKLYTVDIETPLWVGFLFNDYVQIPFTTGYVQVDLVAIDGLSFLDYTEFIYQEEDSINSLNILIDIIAETLNVIDYPEPIYLLTSCSYYAEGMYTRADASSEEPFDQSYQYRRDFVGLTYYEALDNIVKSFGCRLFQSDGMWQILAINEMANDTRYYTKYQIYPSVANAGSGVLDKDVTIEPYAEGNVHFINNSQNKIIRKGYPKVLIKGNFDYADNYVHNGNFKGVYNSAVPPAFVYQPYGWSFFASINQSTYVNMDIDSDLSSNTINISKPVGSGFFAYAEMGGVLPPLSPYLYLPYMNAPSFNISFAYKISFGTKTKLFISIINPATAIKYYYNGTSWQTASIYVDINKVNSADFVSYSETIDITSVNSPTGVALKGYVQLRFYVDGGSPFPLYEDIKIRSVLITQGYSTIRSVDVSRQVGVDNTTIKEIEQPYGSFLNSYSVNNNIGNIVNASGISYTNWFRYPDTANTFTLLAMLMARQYSNLLNKNFGTLEAEIGKFETEKGLNYLDKVFLVEDSATNALSYNDKKFMLNRSNVIPQVDEVTSFQLIEVTNEDNDSVETIKYNIE